MQVRQKPIAGQTAETSQLPADLYQRRAPCSNPANWSAPLAALLPAAAAAASSAQFITPGETASASVMRHPGASWIFGQWYHRCQLYGSCQADDVAGADAAGAHWLVAVPHRACGTCQPGRARCSADADSSDADALLICTCWPTCWLNEIFD